MDLDAGLSGPAVRGSMLAQPYLFFDGRCEEALEFYASALGAEVTMVMRYQEAPDPPPPGMIPPGSGARSCTRASASAKQPSWGLMADAGDNWSSEDFHCPSRRR